MGKIDDMMRFHETALSLRAQRQQLLASNIANADTPNFKARDIDFNAALKGAISKSGGTTPGGNTGPVTASNAGGVSGNDVLRTSTAHMVSTNGRGSIGGAAIKYMTEQQGNIDGNTVDMDVQRNQFTDNAMRYEVSLTLASSKIKGLMSAIQGQ